MSEFFDSEFVREGLNEINELQQEVYGNILTFQNLPVDQQKEHIVKLEELLEKQQLMFTRLSLSDDPEAIKMKKQLQDSVQLMGFPQGTDIKMLFSTMAHTIKKLREKIVD
jgi:hypothetical protein|tara:strand:- start:31 stop:363 length:333 start_codon:yes stop_codon:yes gene_type:complete